MKFDEWCIGQFRHLVMTSHLVTLIKVQVLWLKSLFVDITWTGAYLQWWHSLQHLGDLFIGCLAFTLINDFIISADNRVTFGGLDLLIAVLPVSFGAPISIPSFKTEYVLQSSCDWLSKKQFLKISKKKSCYSFHTQGTVATI